MNLDDLPWSVQTEGWITEELVGYMFRLSRGRHNVTFTQNMLRAQDFVLVGVEVFRQETDGYLSCSVFLRPDTSVLVLRVIKTGRDVPTLVLLTEHGNLRYYSQESAVLVKLISPARERR